MTLDRVTLADALAGVDRLEAEGRLAEASRALVRLAAQGAGRHRLWCRASLLAWRIDQRAEAMDLTERAIEAAAAAAPHERDDARKSYYLNLSEFCRRQGLLEQALAHALAAVALAPEDAGAHYQLGLVRYERLEIEEAMVCDRRAIALQPDKAEAHFELAEALLLSGAFEEGWAEYEWRFSVPGAPSSTPPGYSKPRWQGEPLGPDQTLVLIADQGFGDTIQFCRYIPLVAKRAPRLVVAASKEMRPIVAQMNGTQAVFESWAEAPPHHVYCPLSELPRLFATDLTNIPAPRAYLKAEPAKAARWKARLDGLVPPRFRRIGLVWAGRPTHGNDFNRSTSLMALAPLMELDGIAWVSLQMGAARTEVGGYFGRAPLINLGPEIRDFTDTMAIVAGLDEVVTVDTSMAHLTGALGKPVRVLLPFAPDWRWLRDRPDSPWYPTVRLYRQTSSGDWPSAIDALARDLRN